MLILDKTRINILVDVHFLIPTFQVVLIHINKVGNRINKVGHETTKWVNESTKWVNESTSWTAPNQPRGSRQLYAIGVVVTVVPDIPPIVGVVVETILAFASLLRISTSSIL